jgi:hypothetical protein
MYVVSKDQKSDPKTQKPQEQTRLHSELAARYANQMAPVRKKKPEAGRGSLTEELEDAAPEAEGQEQELEAAELEAAEHEQEPKKSLFELPRKEPSRPTLLGGGVEADTASGAPVQPPSSASSSPAGSPAPSPFGRRSPRRG